MDDGILYTKPNWLSVHTLTHTPEHNYSQHITPQNLAPRTSDLGSSVLAETTDELGGRAQELQRAERFWGLRDYCTVKKTRPVGDNVCAPLLTQKKKKREFRPPSGENDEAWRTPCTLDDTPVR
jgi:hypothetical protein